MRRIIVAMRWTRKERDDLAEVAEDEGSSISAVVRRAVLEYLERRRCESPPPERPNPAWDELEARKIERIAAAFGMQRAPSDGGDK